MSPPRLTAVAGSVSLVAALVFLAGPRVDIDTIIHRPNLPKDLDAYLAATESRFTDITPGTEKKIH